MMISFSDIFRAVTLVKQRNYCGFPVWLLLMTVSGNVSAQANCTPLQVLDRATANESVADSYEGSAMSPGPSQRAVVAEATGQMTSILCKAARRVAFVDQGLESNAGLAGRTDRRSADLLQMSAATSAGLASEALLRYPNELDDQQARIPQDVRRYELALKSAKLARATTMQAIIHESAHSADYLIKRVTNESGVGEYASWTAASEEAARRVVADNLINNNLQTEWQRLHNAFVAADMAKPYHDRGFNSGWSSAEVVKNGFMSQYGGSNLADDIAEMTAWASVSEAYLAVTSSTEASNRKDLACEAMQAHTGNSIPSDLAAVYTKLGFLQTLGFISEEAFKNCVGSLKVRGSGKGFQSYVGSSLSKSYQSNVTTKIGQVDGSGPYFFEMSAEGTAGTSSDSSIPVRVILRLDVSGEEWFDDLEDASFPRGVYKIGTGYGTKNRLWIVRTDNDKVLMEVSHAMALVGRGSKSFGEGSIFMQRIYNYAGGALSAIAGHEPVKAETHITFRY